ncbi:MAG: helix-turn-helix domain-containing protein, partial [Patescibacteria group bacterium]
MIRAGQRLYDERVKKGLSLEDISKATRIRFSYLSAIEKGEYEELPSSTYAQGFVRNYAKHLGLNEEEILGLFRREFNEEKIFRILPEGLDRKEEFSIHGAKIQNTLLVVISLVVILFAYILFQYRYAIISPSLEVDFPKEGAVVSSQTI